MIRTHRNHVLPATLFRFCRKFGIATVFLDGAQFQQNYVALYQIGTIAGAYATATERVDEAAQAQQDLGEGTENHETEAVAAEHENKKKGQKIQSDENPLLPSNMLDALAREQDLCRDTAKLETSLFTQTGTVLAGNTVLRADMLGSPGTDPHHGIQEYELQVQDGGTAQVYAKTLSLEYDAVDGFRLSHTCGNMCLWFARTRTDLPCGGFSLEFGSFTAEELASQAPVEDRRSNTTTSGGAETSTAQGKNNTSAASTSSFSQIDLVSEKLLQRTQSERRSTSAATTSGGASERTTSGGAKILVEENKQKGKETSLSKETTSTTTQVLNSRSHHQEGVQLAGEQDVDPLFRVGSTSASAVVGEVEEDPTLVPPVVPEQTLLQQRARQMVKVTCWMFFSEVDKWPTPLRDTRDLLTCQRTSVPDPTEIAPQKQQKTFSEILAEYWVMFTVLGVLLVVIIIAIPVLLVCRHQQDDFTNLSAGSTHYGGGSMPYNSGLQPRVSGVSDVAASSHYPRISGRVSMAGGSPHAGSPRVSVASAHSVGVDPMQLNRASAMLQFAPEQHQPSPPASMPSTPRGRGGRRGGKGRHK
ncbi:unnamed protein product [Amoebophrya sp. A120]|nr:unnamed protein product [Amoebophrya sp. A120]|eukprot:GSA120T00006060001.1